ncbi:MAG TPA: epoxide hydrolase N-terminal domain-containing protein [Streptosporangiaceae bacterium]
MSATSEQIRPFRIAVPQADLDDLQARLEHARWTSPADPEYGVSLAWVQRLARYWRDGYDWRAAEARLNSYPHFITEIDGQDIHFLHVRSPEPDALPLILTHGWPGSVVEFLDLIPLLTEFEGMSAPDMAALQKLQWFMDHKISFNQLHSQQPQTIAHALADSPVACSPGTGSS